MTFIIHHCSRAALHPSVEAAVTAATLQITAAEQHFTSQ